MFALCGTVRRLAAPRPPLLATRTMSTPPRPKRLPPTEAVRLRNLRRKPVPGGRFNDTMDRWRLVRQEKLEHELAKHEAMLAQGQWPAVRPSAIEPPTWHLVDAKDQVRRGVPSRGSSHRARTSSHTHIARQRVVKRARAAAPPEERRERYRRCRRRLSARVRAAHPDAAAGTLT